MPSPSTLSSVGDFLEMKKLVGKGGTGTMSLIMYMYNKNFEWRIPLILTYSTDCRHLLTKIALIENIIQLDSERENQSVKHLFLIETDNHGLFPVTSLTSQTITLTSIIDLTKSFGEEIRSGGWRATDESLLSLSTFIKRCMQVEPFPSKGGNLIPPDLVGKRFVTKNMLTENKYLC